MNGFEKPNHEWWHYGLNLLIIGLVSFFGSKFVSVTDDMPILKEKLKSLNETMQEMKDVSKNNLTKNDEQIKFLGEIKYQIEIMKQKIEVLNRIHKL